MTYADDYNLRDKALCKINDIANAIDGLLIAGEESGYTSAVTTTSSTYSALASVALTVADGEAVLLSGYCTSSCNTTGNKSANFQLNRDTSAIATALVVTYDPDIVADSGKSNPLCMVGFDAPAAGSYTYSLVWASADNSTTMYSLRGAVTAIKVRNS
jgi:hypothetical protein